MSKIYSDWLRIDLHIHSDSSRQTKNGDYKGNFDVDVLYEKLGQEQVSVFSLTDHNIINIEAYKNYYEKYYKESDPLLLTGVELDIRGSETTYHSLLIFNCTNYEGAKLIHDRLEAKYTEKGMAMLGRELSFDDITNVFENRDYFFIPHAGNTKSIIDGYKDDIAVAQKMLILLQSPMEKVKEKRRQTYNHHFDNVLCESFRKKDDFAYIEFSDNHFIEGYPCRHMGEQGDHEFYYVKGSKNYETLRLAFIDPKSRIKSSAEYNEIMKPRDFLESLSISENNLLTNTELRFSPHLNVIIGGRSSGKSLLMDILNRSIDTLEGSAKYESAIEGSDIMISSSNDAAPVNVSHVNTDILQINQGIIVNYFENNALSSLAKKAGKLDEYHDAKKKFDDIKSGFESSLSTLNDRYETLHALKVDQRLILHDHTLQQLLNTEYHLKIDEEILKAKVYTDKQFDDTIKLIKDTDSSIQRIVDAATIETTEIDQQIIKNFTILLAKLEEQQRKMKMEHTYKNMFVNTAIEVVDTANSTLSQAGQGKALAEKTKQELQKQVKAQFEGFKNLLNATDGINASELYHSEEIILDGDSVLCIELSSDKSMETAILDGIKDSSKNNLYGAITELLYKKAGIKNLKNAEPDNFKKKSVTQFGVFSKCFDDLTDYLKYEDGSTSKSNSPGYNSEKYLKVVLSNPKCGLIIIDQPEDNLGNKFIAEDLVEMIREIKFKKQIFLITHNPAIVVYGDSESIIIAENNDKRISYSQVKLEDVEAQKRICATLDGGEYIFDNRSRKYNIQKLLQGDYDGNIES